MELGVITGSHPCQPLEDVGLHILGEHVSQLPLSIHCQHFREPLLCIRNMHGFNGAAEIKEVGHYQAPDRANALHRWGDAALHTWQEPPWPSVFSLSFAT